ncbi:MAG: GFA family protein, partial [Burkholderiaceae bacterium]
MKLEGSCHCGAVRFSLSSAYPYPYQRCYCSICRKTQGGGGYAINLSGDSSTMKVTGRDNITIYHAKIKGKGSGRAHT